MLIARRKREENIVEYLLYMYQIEDLIRAHKLSIDSLFKSVIAPQIEDDQLAGQYREWYVSLIQQLENQGKQKTGHITDVIEVQLELFYLHNTLLNLMHDERYRKIYEKAIPFLQEFGELSLIPQLNDVEKALHGLYTKLLMRLKGQSISPQTEEAFEAMRNMLAYLANAYHKMRRGELEFFKN
jgi:hypothetical protein